MLQLPGEHEGSGEWLSICPCDLSPWSLGFSHSISCSPPWIHCHPTSWLRLSSAARGNACSFGRPLGTPLGLVLTALSLRGSVSEEIQEYLIRDEEEEDGAESCKAMKQEREDKGLGL